MEYPDRKTAEAAALKRFGPQAREDRDYFITELAATKNGRLPACAMLESFDEVKRRVNGRRA